MRALLAKRGVGAAPLLRCLAVDASKEARPHEKHTRPSKLVSGPPNAGGDGGGGAGSDGGKGGGGGRRKLGGGSGVYVLGAAVAATPVIALAIKAKMDEDGFRDTVKNAGLSPELAQSVFSLFGVEGGGGGDAKQTPSEAASSAAAAAAPPPTREQPSSVDMALATQREKHRLELQKASDAARKKAQDETKAEMLRLQALETRLASNLASLEQERDALKAQNDTLRGSLDRRPPPPAQPQVVFQEMKLSDEVREGMQALDADTTARRVLELLQEQSGGPAGDAATKSFATGVIGHGGIDETKERALSADCSVEEAQKRVKELLIELESRTRLECARLREAVRQARDSAKMEVMTMAAQQLAQQERELQRLMELQVREIRAKAIQSMRERDAQYDERARSEWALVNERAKSFAENTVRMHKLRSELESEEVLRKEREAALAAFTELEEDASQRVRKERDSIMLVQGALQDYSSTAHASQLLHALSLAALGIGSALDSRAPFSDELRALRKCAALGDGVVQAAVVSIPESAAKDGIASLEELRARFGLVCSEARRRMLVPDGGGMFSEMIGSARASFQTDFKDSSVPAEGGGAEGLLRRAQFLVNKGDIRGALDQLAHLEGRPAQAVSGWVESARQRLIVVQALRLLKAHVGAQSLGVDAGAGSERKGE